MAVMRSLATICSCIQLGHSHLHPAPVTVVPPDILSVVSLHSDPVAHPTQRSSHHEAPGSKSHSAITRGNQLNAIPGTPGLPQHYDRLNPPTQEGQDSMSRSVPSKSLQPSAEASLAGDRTQRRRLTIAQAVLELLREGGAAAVTTDAVASRAGASKATIYRYWRDKTELLIAAANLEIQFPEVPDRGSLRVELQELLATRLRAYTEPGNDRLWAALIGASVDDAEFGSRLRKWIYHQMQTNAAIIRRAIRRGELREGTSVDSVATVVGGPLVYRLVLQDEPPDQNLVDTIIECVCKGLSPQPDE